MARCYLVLFIDTRPIYQSSQQNEHTPSRAGQPHYRLTTKFCSEPNPSSAHNEHVYTKVLVEASFTGDDGYERARRAILEGPMGLGPEGILNWANECLVTENQASPHRG